MACICADSLSQFLCDFNHTNAYLLYSSYLNEKLHHADEALSRELVKVVMSAFDGNEEDEPNVLTDTGWFQMDATAVPTGDDLAALQSHLTDAGALAPPEIWKPVADPTVVEQHDISPGSEEYTTVVDAFMSSLRGRNNFNATVHKVFRIQNLAMWQSYVVKRQTICYRETGSSSDKSDEVQKKALERFERCWLWHGSNAEVMDKILQQGFNRSFCGKNATV